ncbi:unnamed protein product [Penicillium manginii]
MIPFWKPSFFVCLPATVARDEGMVTNREQNACDASDLVANVCRLPANLKRSLFATARTRLYEERAPRDTGRAI